MRSNYLPKFAVAVLVLAAAIVLLSGQTAQVAASPSVQNYCDYYGYYSNYGHHHDHHYYGYSSSYDCSYGYYGYYDNYYGNYYGNYGYGYPYDYYSYYNTPAQYKLTVATDPANLGTVTGGGTYNQGSSASFSVTQTTVQSSSNTRYVSSVVYRLPFIVWSFFASQTITSAGPKK